MSGEETEARGAGGIEGEPSVSPAVEQTPVESSPTKDEGDGLVSAEADDLDKAFFVVGVGASAGGLEALVALLQNLTLESMALVIIQHLAREHASMLPELLSRSSQREVLEAHDGMKVEPNHIYVIPPDTDLGILQGTLHLIKRTAGPSVHLPIDFFFSSLAADRGAHAIGVVLSGTGTDGTFGLKAIKAAGGLTFAQDPETAQYDGMPRNAIESGWVDSSLAPAAIADELMHVGKHPYLAKIPRMSPKGQDDIARLLLLIRAAFGNDLTYYKPNTIERRVAKRLALHKMERTSDYLQYVQSNPTELHALYKDMLINVTSFFRDHDPFEALKATAFPKMLEEKKPGAAIRVWVAACATGEEAYSIAMALVEHLEDRARDFRIQLFGTDVDEESIQYARRGVYPENIALDVSPERLHRFFVKNDGSYQICRLIRDMVVFSAHDITRDAPFSRLDLVSCRNLLIYLQPVMQKKVLRVIHYALKPTGFLMLGTSETVGDSPDLFSLVDRKNKLYSAKHVAAIAALDTSFGARAPQPSIQPGSSLRPIANLAAMADRKVLERYGPPGVVINQSMEILHFRGRTGPYLEPAPGAASLNILRLARPELHADLRRVIHQALSENKETTADSRLVLGAETRPFRLEVVPITEPDTKTKCLLVLFNEPAAHEHDETAPLPVSDGAASPSEQRIQELERELSVTKEYLQSTVEELESTNEELKSANEELQSSNEELQSTNEELETSKEEMQSSNEELSTVNDELQTRMRELQTAHDDLRNVMTGVDQAVVIVGMDLRIRRFTHSAEMLLSLVAGDVGRTVGHLNSFVTGERVEQLAANVIATLSPAAKEVLCADRRWHLLRITPYRTLEHTIKGVVITLTDVHLQHHAAQLGEDVARYASEFLQVITHPLMIVDANLRVLWVNEAFYCDFQVVAEETVGNVLPKIGAGQWADEGLRKLLDGTVATGSAFRDYKVTRVFPDVGEMTVHVSGSRVPPIGGSADLILLAFEEDLAKKASGGGPDERRL
jgi:two-component system CheB/CheR fusion protein